MTKERTGKLVAQVNNSNMTDEIKDLCHEILK